MAESFEVPADANSKIERFASIFGYSEQQILEAALHRGLTGLGRLDVKKIIGKAGDPTAPGQVQISEELLETIDRLAGHLKAEHLQSKDMDAFRAAGGITISDAVALYKKLELSGDMLAKLEILSKNCSVIRVDWVSFLDGLKRRPTYAIFTSRVLDLLATAYGKTVLTSTFFGLPSEALPEGMTLKSYVRKLAKGDFIDDENGMTLMEKARSITNLIQEGTAPDEIFSDMEEEDPEPIQLGEDEEYPFEAIIPDVDWVDNIPIKKFASKGICAAIEEHGATTLKDLRDMPRSVLINLPRLGERRLNHMADKIEASVQLALMNSKSKDFDPKKPLKNLENTD